MVPRSDSTEAKLTRSLDRGGNFVWKGDSKGLRTCASVQEEVALDNKSLICFNSALFLEAGEALDLPLPRLYFAHICKGQSDSTFNKWKSP